MLKKAFIAACAAITVAGASAAFANDDPADTRWYLTGLYDFNNPDSNRSADGDSVGMTLGFGKHLSHRFALEATSHTVNLKGSTSDELAGYGLNLLFYPMGREYGMFTIVGYGEQTTKATGLANSKSDILDLGIGFMRDVGSAGTQLRGQLKARYDEHNDAQGLNGGATSSTDYIASFGFLKPFGENQGDSYRFPAFDGEQDRRIYSNLGLSFNRVDNGFNVEDNAGTGMRLGLGMFLRRTLSVELHADIATYDLNGGGELDQSDYGIDLFAYKSRNPVFAPFTVLGAGVSEYQSAGASVDGNYVDLGFGFLSNFTDYGLGIRFDLRYRTAHLSDSSQNTHSGIANLGLNIPFGAPPPPPDDDNDGVADTDDQCPNTPSNTPVDEEGCPLDSDKDGVIDPQDACPNTPAGTEVDARGCEIDKDSDGDGVNDSKDECPGTAEGVAVGPNGCPVDDDDDGVINNKDECPETPAGLEVDGRGCVVVQSTVLKGINFEFNSATLTPHAKRLLNDMAALWGSQPALEAQISGHTDWMGPSDYNLQLSQQRANSVKAYLISKGVPANQLDSKGYGESRPIADNETELGRAENRRVEFEVQ